MTGKADSHRAFYSFIVPLMIAELVSALELTMIYAAMRTLVADFGGTREAGWLVTSFMLSSAAGAALFGRVGDLIGRRKVLLWVLALSTIGSLISSVTRELDLLILGRAMQGLAGAIIPLCFGMVQERASVDRVPLGISLISSSASIAAASGLVIGGLIIDYSDWTMIFKISAALGLVAFLTVFLFVSPDQRRQSIGLGDDLLGGMLFVPAAVCLLLGIDSASKVGLSSPVTLAWLTGAAVSLIAWVWRELSVANPLIDVRLLARREIAVANLLFVAVALGSFQGGHLMALFGQQPVSTGTGLGLSATMAGFLLLPANILTALLYPAVAAANRRYGPRLVASAGCSLIIAGFLALTFFNDDLVMVMLLLVVQSLGLGVCYVTIPIVIVGAAPEDRTSEASGMMSVIRSTAMAIGAQTVATILSAAGHGAGKGHAFPSEADYQTAFLYVVATGLVGLVVSQMLPRRLPSQTVSSRETA